MKVRTLLPLLCMSSVTLLCPSCGQKAANVEAHSFNVISGVFGDSYELSGGYSQVENGKMDPFAPGAVFVVGVKEGATLGVTTFDYGAIVLVEGTDTEKKFRLAEPKDKITVKHEVEVFGKKYAAGPFPIPPEGNLASAE